MHKNGFWELLKINYTKHILLLLHKEEWESLWQFLWYLFIYVLTIIFKLSWVADLLLYYKNMYVYNLSVCIYVMSKNEDLWKYRSNNG